MHPASRQPGRQPGRSRGLLLATIIAAGTAGCGSAAPTVAPPAPTASLPAPTRAATVPPQAATPSPEPAPTTAPPELTGDAATNPACKLASIAEISGQVRAGVKEMRGLTSPGAFAENSLSCAWYLDSEEIGIPSVLVQWEFPVVAHHDAVVDLYELMVDQGLATAVEGIGDMTILQGATAETVAGEEIVRVSVLQHPEPTETDKADAVALLQLMLERTEQR